MLIFLVSSIPGKVINESGFGNEILHINGHFLMFFTLMLTNFYATKNLGFAFLITFGYAVFDEVHQIFTPNRNAGLFDLYTDTLGAGVGGIILWKAGCFLPSKLKNMLYN